MSSCVRSFVLCALVFACGISAPLYMASADDTTTSDQTVASAKEGTTADQTEELETPEVIVSATKTPIPVKEVTSAVEVISGEQMQQRKLRTVAEALRWAQGLAVFQSGGPGTVVDVRMRGGTPEQTLVLIDGAIVNSATLGSYDFAQLTSDNIERIEMTRRPEAARSGLGRLSM